VTKYLHFVFAAFLFSSVSIQGANSQDLNVGDRVGDWIFECIGIGVNQTRCLLTQRLVLENNQQEIMRLTLSTIGDSDQVLLTARVPLGIFLPSGVAARIDNGEDFQLTPTFCRQEGCEAQVILGPDLLDAMKRGNEILVGFRQNPNSDTIVVPASLIGVSRGLSAIF
jgi:invasion protein IalB